MIKHRICLPFVVAATALFNASNALANDVLKLANSYPDGGGYKWVAGNSGTPAAIEFDGEVILPKGDGTICCGYTLSIAVDVAKARGLLNGKTADDLRRFHKLWYGDGESGDKSLCVLAVESLGIGHAVDVDDAKPGDFVQLWRDSGSGHSVIFLERIMDDDAFVGFRYRSSQGSTDGIGDRSEYFSDDPQGRGSVLREQTYVCRLNAGSGSTDALPPEIAMLIADGQFVEAEKKLRQQTGTGDTPAMHDAALQLELIRRVRHDFALSTDEVLEQIRESIPDATPADLTRWRDAGDLQYRVIDGRPRYFRRAVSNLYRFNADARLRRQVAPQDEQFDYTSHIVELVALSEQTDEPEIYPIRQRVRYRVSVNPDCPDIQPGAVVRAWLPFPQEYRQQSDVRLLKSSPTHQSIAPNGSPHRSVYFEQTLTTMETPPSFEVEFEYQTSAWAPKLDPIRVESYDVPSDLYRKYTAERLPHIALPPSVRQLSAEIVGDESNPLEKARLVFRWVSKNIPWCAEMEYSIIPSLSTKGLAARRGDCGVQSLVFVSLCRAAGVPARWQSGWQTQPGGENLHDWSEIYIEPWGWLPADASHGVRDHADPQVRDFLCGHTDPYRMIVNLDYSRELTPAKTSFRSEPNDFQRGEIEIDGHNLYFDEWTYQFEVESERLEPSAD
ncbi:MAG: transglutaminase domain-containing protein [Planctomycetota bacterium]